MSAMGSNLDVLRPLAGSRAAFQVVGECWMWSGGVDGGRSPKRSVGGRYVSVVRAVWEEVHGALDEGAVVVRSCGNRLCVRPEHLALRDDGPLYELAAGGCWLWARRLDRQGYGKKRFEVRGVKKDVGAHRWMWEREVGPVPDGMQLHHLCRVRRCVNPAHLEVVTTRDHGLRHRGGPRPRMSVSRHPGRDDAVVVTMPSGEQRVAVFLDG
jgi:hypothetical protein